MNSAAAPLGPYFLRNGIAIFPEHDRAIESALGDLLQRVPARFVLLTDASGQVISFQGERREIDVVALGALLAGDLAASQAIARLTREYEEYQTVLREGQRNHTFVVAAGRHLVLFAQVPAEVPLGWARLLVMEAARRLAAVLQTDHAPADITSPLTEAQAEAQGLTDLFSQALDDMWTK